VVEVSVNLNWGFRRRQRTGVGVGVTLRISKVVVGCLHVGTKFMTLSDQLFLTPKTERCGRGPGYYSGKIKS